MKIFEVCSAVKDAESEAYSDGVHEKFLRLNQWEHRKCYGILQSIGNSN